MSARRALLLAALAGLAGCSDGQQEQGRAGAGAPATAATAPAQAAAPTTVAHRPDPEHGKAVFDHFCAPCHAPGMENPGTMNLSLRLGPEKGPLEHRDDLHPEYVKAVVRHGLRLMPAFRPTEFDDRELEDLAAYLAGGNGG